MASMIFFTHLLVLVRSHCHELCLGEDVRAESVADLLLDREGLVRFSLHYVYPGLVLMHGVQYQLQRERKNTTKD